MAELLLATGEGVGIPSLFSCFNASMNSTSEFSRREGVTPLHLLVSLRGITPTSVVDFILDLDFAVHPLTASSALSKDIEAEKAILNP